MCTTILLVRHGQTEWNRVERFRGQFDVPLNATGLRQASQTAERIARQWHPEAVYTSPLGRAAQTAAAIAAACGLQAAPCPGLIDIHYGLWQGLTPDETREQWPDDLANWYEHPEKAEIPGGESLGQVRERALAALADHCQQHRGQQMVLVSHTVVNRLILLGVLGLGNERFWFLRQEPCAINVIERSAQGDTLVSMNDFGHTL